MSYLKIKISILKIQADYVFHIKSTQPDVLMENTGYKSFSEISSILKIVMSITAHFINFRILTFYLCYIFVVHTNEHKLY